MSKMLVQMVLLVAFWSLFGSELLERYQEKKVVVTISESDYGYIPAPAVTVCALDTQNQIGFKMKMNMSLILDFEIISSICAGKTDREITNCIEESTYSLNSSIKHLARGFQIDQVEVKWHPEFSVVVSGMCHTLEAGFNLGFDFSNSSMMMEFNESLSVITYIHDEKFFFINSNPGLPFNEKRQGDPKMIEVKFLAVEHRNLDTPSKRCNPDPAYSFSACVKEAFSRDAGCRLKWDRWTDRALPICHHLKQYRFLMAKIRLDPPSSLV